MIKKKYLRVPVPVQITEPEMRSQTILIVQMRREAILVILAPEPARKGLAPKLLPFCIHDYKVRIINAPRLRPAVSCQHFDGDQGDKIKQAYGARYRQPSAEAA
jgi:hypothetical protein